MYKCEICGSETMLGAKVGRFNCVCPACTIEMDMRERALTTRTRNALRRADITSKEDLIRGLEEGIEVRGIGHVSKQEIEDYVDFPIIIERVPKRVAMGGRIYRAWVSRIRRA